MTVEELLKPRYKIIADYPKSIYHVGDIINAGTTSEDCIYCDREGQRMRNYPHLFKSLQWWEERSPEDMPEYVKLKANHKDVVKVKGWSGCNSVVEFNDGMEGATDFWLPATREEDEAYNIQSEKHTCRKRRDNE